MKQVWTGIAAAAVLALPNTAYATDEDTQLWLWATAQTDIADGTRLVLQANPRVQLDNTRNNQLFLNGAINYKLSENVTIGGGVILLGEFGPTEVRPHQSISVAFGEVSVRFMAEERFFEGADQMELRLRQRLQWSPPIADDTKLVISGETFFTPQNKTKGGDTGLTQWRAILGVNHKINDQWSVNGGYLALGSVRSGAEDALAHIPHLGATLTF